MVISWLDLETEGSLCVMLHRHEAYQSQRKAGDNRWNSNQVQGFVYSLARLL